MAGLRLRSMVNGLGLVLGLWFRLALLGMVWA